MCTTDFCNDLDYDIHSGRAIPVLKLPGNRSRTAISFPGNDLQTSSSGGEDSISAFLERQKELRDNGSYYSLLREENHDEGLRVLLDYYDGREDEVEEDEEEEEEVGHGVGEDRGGGDEEDQRAGRVPRQVAQGRKCDDSMQQTVTNESTWCARSTFWYFWQTRYLFQ